MRSYYSFSEYLKTRFERRVQRISLNAGFDCPNRNGTLSASGCIFCNEKGFSRFAGTRLTLAEQIKESMNFVRARFGAEKFLAYFQNASGTYAQTAKLKEAYDVIKDFPDIVGLFISTRPDCMDEEKLDLVAGYCDNYEVWVEYGVQSVHDKSLKYLNRSHTFSQSLEAIENTARRGIKVGTHIIIGIPGETREDIIETARVIAHLPVSGVKLHVLHILRDTPLEKVFIEGKLNLLKQDEYISLACDFIERLDPGCVILRLVSDANPAVLVSPAWINEKQKLIESVESEFNKRGTCQGAKYDKNNLCVR
ncbi:MAG: TIGR01212 family radical SAM protein [Candidatus Omnitrophica bacterium]|nr:TIGR01212 family radical SAM protein [Candidatus Omnitrophota bacterium]